MSWNMAEFVADNIEVEELGLDDHEDAQPLLKASYEPLWLARNEAVIGSRAFGRVRKFDDGLIGDRFTEDEEYGIRMGDEYLVYGKKNKGWRMIDVAAFVRFVISQAPADEVPELLAAVFPDYGIRVSAVGAVGEKLGMTREVARDTFAYREWSEKKEVATIPASRAKVGWLALKHGEFIPKKEEKK